MLHGLCSRCGKWELVFTVVHGLGLQACRLQSLRLSNSSAQAQQLWRTGLVSQRHVGPSHMGPGIEPMSPTLAGRLLSTEPPAKPPNLLLTSGFRRTFLLMKSVASCSRLGFTDFLLVKKIILSFQHQQLHQAVSHLIRWQNRHYCK